MAKVEENLSFLRNINMLFIDEFFKKWYSLNTEHFAKHIEIKTIILG